MKEPMFDWDGHNLRKIRAHRIAAEEVEQALMSDPILIYEQDVAGEQRFVYYGGTDAGRLLAVVVTERRAAIRVVTAYELDADKSETFCGDECKETGCNEQEAARDATIQDRR